MSDSEFEFEDNDCDPFDADGSFEQGTTYDSNSSVNDRLLVENAYYEAEDAVTRDPAKAVDLFSRLYELLSDKQACGSTMTGDALCQWRIKVLQHLIKLPGPDFQCRVEYFRELLQGMEAVASSLETSRVLTSALDALESKFTTKPDKCAHDLMIDIHLTATKSAERLGNMTSAHSITLRLGQYLLRAELTEQFREWLATAYWNWLRSAKHIDATFVDEPDRGLLNDPRLFAAINTAPAEDSHILGILALDLDFCRTQGNNLRPTFVLMRCSKVSRALLDRRTQVLLRENVGKFELYNGHYDNAYRAFYDAWEAVFSLGNTVHAGELLLRLMLCMILCESKIDPLSTREARTLIGSADNASQLAHRVEFLQQVQQAFQEGQIKSLVTLLTSEDAYDLLRGPNAILADCEFLAEELIVRVREREFARRCLKEKALSLSELQEQLVLSSSAETQQFVTLTFARNRDSKDSQAPTGWQDGDLVAVKEQQALADNLTEIQDICADLLSKARAINMELL